MFHRCLNQKVLYDLFKQEIIDETNFIIIVIINSMINQDHFFI